MATHTDIYQLLTGIVDGEDLVSGAEQSHLSDTLEDVLLALAELIGPGVFTASDFNGTLSGWNLILSPGRAVVGGAGSRKIVHNATAVTKTLSGSGTRYAYLQPDGDVLVSTSATAPAGTLLICTTDGSTVNNAPSSRLNLVSALAARVSGNDQQPGYLAEKLTAASGITLTPQNDGGNETLQIGLEGWIAGVADTKQVKVSADDATEGYLNTKIQAGSGVTLATEDNGLGGKVLRLSASGSGNLSATEVSDFLDIELAVGEEMYLVWDHHLDATFAVPLSWQVWGEVNGSVCPGLEIERVDQTPDGDVTDGTKLCIRVKNISAGTPPAY